MAIATLLATMIAPVAAQELGTDKGEVVFRVTLTGQVDPDDGFAIFSRCPDEWCQSQVIAGGPIEHPVVACGRGLADQVTCTATTYEWTVELDPGTLEYRFERMRDLLGDNEVQILHTGTWEVHSGRQVLTFEYAYPAQSSGGGVILPDTALPAP